MLLTDSDWASMAHSLEIRVPLVDLEFLRKVVPLLARCPGMGKQQLAIAAWENPPQELLARPKTGFSFPTREWLFEEYGIQGRGLRGWAEVVYREAQRPYISRA